MKTIPFLAILIAFLPLSQEVKFTVKDPGRVTGIEASLDTSNFLANELESMIKLKLITGKQAKKLSGILSAVEVEYLTPGGKVEKGILIVHKNVAQQIRKIFRELVDSGFVIEKIEPMSKYGWSDERSMNANNTSAFNYRLVAGTRSISKHANGLALDINPLWNPFVSGKHISPKGAVYDKKRPGTIHTGSPAYKIFKKQGWKWGGEWIPYQDYQHFFFDKITVKSF